MLNRYPLWKYLLLVAVIIGGLLYSLPTLYGEDPAVQISALKNTTLNQSTFDKVKTYLDENNLPYKGLILENNQLMIRVQDEENQNTVQQKIATFLGKNYAVAPNLAPVAPEWFADIGAQPIKKGLDLRGGVYFLLEVDLSGFLEKKIEKVQSDFISDFNHENIPFASILIQKNQLLLNFANTEDLSRATGRIRMMNQFETQVDGNEMIVRFNRVALEKIENEAIDQNVSIIRNRINQLGVSEPIVQRQGTNRIAVQLPGIQDTVEAKQILGATATLDFRAVNPNMDLAQAVYAKTARAPLDSELFTLHDKRHGDQPIPYLLYKKTILTGDHITDSNARLDERQGVVVDIALDSEGGKIMSQHTRNHIGNSMAVLYTEYLPSDKKNADGSAIFNQSSDLVNVATIQGQFSNRFQVSGIGDINEARRLSMLLRAGALTAPIQIIEENVIGPSMGKERIVQGLESCLWGLGVTVLFMLVLYRLFGVFASLAVSLNLILIVAIMAIIPGATLTMPGIAGIVLTVAMAVDANVLINERIKEELRVGRSPQQAIHEGYKGAWSSIFDANITTLMTAVILYVAGTGSIKGFAITLGIGVLTSMFTSIFGTRALANLIYGGRKVNKLSI